MSGGVTTNNSSFDVVSLASKAILAARVCFSYSLGARRDVQPACASVTHLLGARRDVQPGYASVTHSAHGGMCSPGVPQLLTYSVAGLSLSVH